jgi:hypothetical protein
VESLLYLIPYFLVFIVDRVQAFRGVSNPKTWRLYAGIAITAIVAWVVSSHMHGSWGEVVYCALWGIGYPISYVWNNSADTTF